MCAPGALSPRGMTFYAQRLATVLCMRNGKSGPDKVMYGNRIGVCWFMSLSGYIPKDNTHNNDHKNNKNHNNSNDNGNNKHSLKHDNP